MKQIIVVIEPCFFGIGYIKAAKAIGIPVTVVVSSPENPEKYGYEKSGLDIVVADIRSAEAVVRELENNNLFGRIAAVIAGNQFTTDIAAHVAKILGVRGLPHKAALRGRLKDLAREAYAGAGVPSPAFARIRNREEALLAARSIGYPVILKPTDGASSQHVYLVHNEEKLEAILIPSGL